MVERLEGYNEAYTLIYSPADSDFIPAGFEVYVYRSNMHCNISLWRIRTYLHPYKVHKKRTTIEDVLLHSGSRVSDLPDLPYDAPIEDVENQFPLLTPKAEAWLQLEDEHYSGPLFEVYPTAHNRPSSLAQYRRKKVNDLFRK